MKKKTCTVNIHDGKCKTYHLKPIAYGDWTEEDLYRGMRITNYEFNYDPKKYKKMLIKLLMYKAIKGLE